MPSPFSFTRRTTLVGLAAAVTLSACARASEPAALPTVPEATTTTIVATPTTAAADPTTSEATTVPPPTTTIVPTTTAAPESTTTTATTTATTTTTTTTTTAATTVAPPATTTTTTAAPASATDPSASAWIEGVEEGDPEVTSDGVNCLGFYEAMGATGYSACGEWNALGGRRIWTVTKGATDRFFAVVWQETGSSQWVPRLRLLEPSAGTWSSVVLRAADIDGGPNEELISGIRSEGTGGYLDIDVIDAIGGNPSVVAHVPGADRGIASTEANLGVWIYTAVSDPDEPNCCPSRYSQYLLASDGGDWILSEGAPGVPTDMVPTGEF
ncbi:MAG: hypothetical protein R8G01_03330 [Ilumatobacteraceae bacterium]|nr:hypothetical protein [Ilumatobacteraceae bacterium]